MFGGELELIYEISHNLVQKEQHPEFGEVLSGSVEFLSRGVVT